MTGDPVTMLVMKVVGTAVSAIGSIQQGNNAQRAANYNAQVAFNNAAAARHQAAEEAKREKRQGVKRMGAMRAHDPDKLDLLEDSAMEEELNFQTVLHGGEMQAIGYENTARLEIARGKAARATGYAGAAGALLSGAGSSLSLMGGGGGGGGWTNSYGGSSATMATSFQKNPSWM